MAPHSSTLAWKIPWMEEPGRLQSMGLLRVGHDWATSLSLFTFMHWRRKWQPTQCSCLENPREGGAWWAAICEVAQSQTRLKQLSSSSNFLYYSSDYIPHTLLYKKPFLMSHEKQQDQNPSEPLKFFLLLLSWRVLKMKRHLELWMVFDLGD